MLNVISTMEPQMSQDATKSYEEIIADHVADSSGGMDLLRNWVLWKLGKGDFQMIDADLKLDHLIESAEALEQSKVTQEEMNADMGDSFYSYERDSGGNWEGA
jgi:hypothetical protein